MSKYRNKMDEPLDLSKKRPGPWDKQLDCEGIDVDDTKGKIAHIETDNLIDDNYTIDDVLKIIDYIMCTCSEMDLQTKTPEEIFEEYNDNRISEGLRRCIIMKK